MTARIYTYGCLEPIAGHETALEQLRLSSRYRNALVELERERRERVLQQTRAYFPRLLDLEAEVERANFGLEALAEEIRQENAAQRRKRATAEQQTRMRQLRQQRTDLYTQLKAVKREAYGPTEVTDLRQQIRAATRTGDVALTARLEGQLVEVVAGWQARVPAAAELRQELDRIEQRANERQKELRANCGLYWGSYLCVEDAAKTFRQGAPPDFKGFRGEGRLGVQVQGGITAEQLLAGEDERIKLELLPPRNGNREAKLWFRIGSTCREVLRGEQWVPIDQGQQQKRKDGIALRYTLADGTTDTAAPGQWRGEAGRPVWCVVPCVYSRDIPEGCLLKQVYLHRRKVGYRWEWSASFVLAGPAECFTPTDLAQTGVVAINLGWRIRDDGSVRVAYWVGDDGQEGELTISAAEIDRRWEFAESLQAIRSRLLTEAIERLATWCEQNEGLLPAEFRARLCDREEQRRTLRQWRSPERLARLVVWWRDHRFTGDEEIYRWMEGYPVPGSKGNGRQQIVGFRRQEKHLADWQAGIRERAERWRQDVYRNFAALLSRRYRTLLLADVNWRETAAKPVVESNESENQTARYNVRLAAPGKLEAILRNRFADVQALDAANLTQTCAGCGHLDPFDARDELVRQCRRCDWTEDQDRRHCRNLLRLARGEVLNENP